MLVPIVFIVALTLTLATVLIESGLAATRLAFDTTVSRYADVAVADGVADLTARLAGDVQRNGSATAGDAIAPDSTAPRALCDASVPAGTCPFFATVSSRITDAAAVDATQPPRTDAVDNVQTSAIAERRISAVVSVTIRSRAGTRLGTRTRLLTYRIFEAPPYAVVSGARDTTAVVGSRANAPGDSGGAVAGGESADTRIHVQLTCRTVIANVVPFQNDQQPAGNDGLPWGNQTGAAYEAPCHQDASPADAFADQTWTNGNANDAGWTP